MRLRSKLPAILLLAMAMAMVPGHSAVAQEKKSSKNAKKPAAAKPVDSPKKPAPSKLPDPSAPTVKSAESPPTGAARPGGADPNRAKALVRAITAQEKSEKAGEVFKQFMEGTPEQRGKLIADPAKNSAEAVKYFTESPNRDFKPLSIQILGTVTSPSVPDRMFFPYFVATDKNPLGFVTVVVETTDGFRVDWASFVRGHDLNLDAFFSEKKPESSVSALLGISRSHIFEDQAPAGGESKFHAFSIEMPPPPLTEDPPKAFIEKDSATGKMLGSKLGWTRGHLCWLTISWEAGSNPVLKIKAYQPYAK